ncbi:hypothetical protein AVEN_16786-1 [Araneus ventricosus]|uniref:Uncharacterized protein n=1 Tax=Araneus ventricosus TaxID=182803 RepID=A0A4Y2BRG5_ARAVE|nr:hypothetical protein AVEN_16786-1 [Araneus ventricosus]
MFCHVSCVVSLKDAPRNGATEDLAENEEIKSLDLDTGVRNGATEDLAENEEIKSLDLDTGVKWICMCIGSVIEIGTCHWKER